MNSPEWRPVLSKADFARRYIEGEFGNRSPSWNTLEEFIRSGYRSGLVHIRNRVANGPTWYDIPPELVESKARELFAGGFPADQLYYSAMAPTALTTFQGEVVRREGLLDVFFSQVAKPMRAALAEEGRAVSGALALYLLRRWMDPGSYDWVMELLDRYLDHVVEFSCYSRCWGTIPRRNTVIWEVRKY